jgi:hypothetical protein
MFKLPVNNPPPPPPPEDASVKPPPRPPPATTRYSTDERTVIPFIAPIRPPRTPLMLNTLLCKFHYRQRR